MEILNIHSHNNGEKRLDTIYNTIYPTLPLDKNYFYSIGIHPWYIPQQIDWENFRQAAELPHIIAIGEAGIDKIKGPELSIQENIFKTQAYIAEEVKKPLIIHMVKSQEEIIKLHREINPDQKWIIHGFRGKPEQLNQLIQNNIIISFGEHYNHQALVKLNNILVETDDSNTTLEEVLNKISRDRNEDINELKYKIVKYTQTLFI